MDTLTLRGRGGVTMTLFAPRAVPGGVEAHALLVSAPLPRPRTLRDDNKRTYRAPAIPGGGFLIAHIVLPEVK